MTRAQLDVAFPDPADLADDALLRNVHRGFHAGLAAAGYPCAIWNRRDARWLDLVAGEDDRDLLRGRLERLTATARYRGVLTPPPGWDPYRLEAALREGLRTEFDRFDWSFRRET